MFPRKNIPTVSSWANTSYLEPQQVKVCLRKIRVSWLSDVEVHSQQRDFAMSGVSQEEMDSCVFEHNMNLYKYIYIYARCYFYIT